MNDRARRSGDNDGFFLTLGVLLVAAALADRFLGLYILTDLLRVLVLIGGGVLIYLGYRAKNKKKKATNDTGQR